MNNRYLLVYFIFFVLLKAADDDIQIQRMITFVAYQRSNYFVTEKIRKLCLENKIKIPKDIPYRSIPKVQFSDENIANAHFRSHDLFRVKWESLDSVIPQQTASAGNTPRSSHEVSPRFNFPKSVSAESSPRAYGVSSSQSPRRSDGSQSPRRQESKRFIDLQEGDEEFCLAVMDIWAKDKAAFYKRSENLKSFCTEPESLFTDPKEPALPSILEKLVVREILTRNGIHDLYVGALVKLRDPKLNKKTIYELREEIDEARPLLSCLTIKQALYLVYALRKFHFTMTDDFENIAEINKKQFKDIKKSLPKELKSLLKKKIEYNA